MGTTLEYILNKIGQPLTKSPMVYSGGRWIGLCKLFEELQFNIGAEIGVEYGYFSDALCKANPNLKLYSIDAWTTYSGWDDYNSQERLDLAEKEARQRLAKYNCEIIKGFSMDVVKTFKDESLDFVFIDGAHDFQNVTNDICEWSKKVRKDGIIAGHDFFRSKGKYINDVVDVVGAYCYAKKINWFRIVGDQRNSWMFVKQ